MSSSFDATSWLEVDSGAVGSLLLSELWLSFSDGVLFIVHLYLRCSFGLGGRASILQQRVAARSPSYSLSKSPCCTCRSQ